VPIPASGTWTDVTRGGVDLVNMLSCENYGSITMVADLARPSDLFTQFHCEGVWKSVDYGLTWSGSINPGMAEPGPAELEGSPLREIRMDSLQSFIRLAFAATRWRRSTGFLSARRQPLSSKLSTIKLDCCPVMSETAGLRQAQAPVAKRPCANGGNRCTAVGEILEAFTPHRCNNYFR
jgi:hypothetical protein